MKRILYIFLALSGLSAYSGTKLQAQLPSSILRVSIDGEDPADWPPEKVFETRLNFKGGTDQLNRQRFYLDQIIDGKPEIYAPMAADVLGRSSNPYHLALCAEYIRAHPNKSIARNAVLKFLKRSDTQLPRDAVEIAANTLAKVGEPEDAQWLIPFFEDAGLSDRHSLWRSIAEFGGIDYYELMLEDISSMKEESDAPENAHRKPRYLAVISALEREKSRFEERLGIVGGDDDSIKSPPLAGKEEGTKNARSPSKENLQEPTESLTRSQVWPNLLVAAALLGIIVGLIRARKIETDR